MGVCSLPSSQHTTLLLQYWYRTTRTGWNPCPYGVSGVHIYHIFITMSIVHSLMLPGRASSTRTLPNGLQKAPITGIASPHSSSNHSCPPTHYCTHHRCPIGSAQHTPTAKQKLAPTKERSLVTDSPYVDLHSHQDYQSQGCTHSHACSSQSISYIGVQGIR